jgi:hypothetical protein
MAFMAIFQMRSAECGRARFMKAGRNADKMSGRTNQSDIVSWQSASVGRFFVK